MRSMYLAFSQGQAIQSIFECSRVTHFMWNLLFCLSGDRRWPALPQCKSCQTRPNNPQPVMTGITPSLNRKMATPAAAPINKEAHSK